MNTIRFSFALLLIFVAACTSSASMDTELLNIDPGVDPQAWVSIPAGEFLSGQHNHEELVDYDYEIMVTDVTNAQFAAYLNDALATDQVKIVDGEVLGYYPGDPFHGHEHEEEIHAGDWLHMPIEEGGLRIEYVNGKFVPIIGYENHPVVMVTWFGANAYCDFNGWRLPTEIEWEKAGRGDDGRPFPWGEKVELNNANFYSSHDIFEKITGKFGDTTPVGFYNGKTYQGYVTLNSVSPFGLYDMAGNVWQWTGNVYEDQHYRYMRGGSKDNYAYNLRLWTRNSAAPNYYSPSVGFRCARDTQ